MSTICEIGKFKFSVAFTILLSCKLIGSSGWWLPPLRVCPLGYVEVRGCVPVDHLEHGSIRPIGHPLNPPPPRGKPQPEKAGPPSPSSPPPQKECPNGFKWSPVFGGCVFEKKPNKPKQSPGASPGPKAPPSSSPPHPEPKPGAPSENPK